MLCLSAILNDIMVERVEMTIKRRHCLMASSSVLTKVLTTIVILLFRYSMKVVRTG